MKHTLTTVFRSVLLDAVASVTTLAREAGYSPVTLDTYRNRRPPSVAAARALADALESRAARLLKDVEQLREAADNEDQRGSTGSRRRRVRP